MFLMQSTTPSNLGGGVSTVIAVSGGRHSSRAVKWAVEHLLHKNSSCILIYVRTLTIHPSSVDDVVDVSKHGRPPTEEELHQLFLPFRGFCARKGITAKELVLHDLDVANALTDYVVENHITTVVVGADTSAWNSIMRKFSKDGDVPTSLAKSLPDTCTLYVVSKGKAQRIRPTGQYHHHHHRVQVTPTNHLHDQVTPTNHQQIQVTPAKSIREIGTLHQNTPMVHPHMNMADTLEYFEVIERKLRKDSIGRDSDKIWECLREIKYSLRASSLKLNEYTDSPRGPPEYSSSSHTSSPRTSRGSSDSTGQHLVPPLIDKLHENHEVFVSSEKHKGISKPLINLEMEMRKLREELKKTTEKYGMACKEAVIAKQKAMELEKSRQARERNVEEARIAEETALALAEVERQKAKAAIEAAEMSQRLAEMETQKRMEVELRAKQEEEEMKKALREAVCTSIPYRRYKIEELRIATNDFDYALKIGEGGYGPVFKGVLDNTVVAIKVLRPDMTHGEKQFQQEVIVLSTIRHPNMVILLGACTKFGCLIYEYMENGSLEERLFMKDNTPPIPWKARFKIASEIATALLFLHQRKPEPLVHRDLKPANILLDKNFVSKISDVGLARLVPPSVADKTTQYRLTGAAGTFCYIDPEYQQTGLLGVKSDIYSFGVVLLQIITGRPPMGLSHLVEMALQKGTFSDVLDPNVSDWPVEEAMSVAKLALKCCELRKRDRPDLSTVVLPELNRISRIWNYEEPCSPHF